MRGRSLFGQLYWRVLALLAVCLALLAGLGFYWRGKYQYSGWQRDLRDQAAWVAGAWPAGRTPAEVAAGWGGEARPVRLTVLAADGTLLADSRPGRPPPDPADERLDVLEGAAPLSLPTGPATLVLSRAGMPPYPMHGEIPLVVLALLAAAGLVLWPVTRRVTRTVDALSALAGRVAGGRFGETLAGEERGELRGLVASFNAMSLGLRDAEARQTRLIADVSHELRSPLGRVRALAETIARHPAEAPELLARIDGEVALMDRLVGDMLEATRAGEGTLALDPRPVDLRAWAAEAFASARVRVERSGASCRVVLPAAGAEVVADPDRLRQALGNLVENAVAAVAGRPDGEVSLELAVGAADWCLRVRDNGKGIPAADLPLVFDRFYRVERHRGHRTGAGLGLPITRGIAEAHGGKAGLDSTEGVGTLAWLRFPLAPPASAPQGCQGREA